MRVRLPEKLEERDEVLVPVSVLHGGLEKQAELFGERKIDTLGASEIEDEADVLEHEARRERRRVVVLEQRLRLVPDELRPDRGGADRLEQLGAIHARALAEHE